MAEVKYVHQNVGFEAVDAAAGIFKITNRFYFTNLKKYQIHYNVCLLYTSVCATGFHWIWMYTMQPNGRVSQN